MPNKKIGMVLVAFLVMLLAAPAAWALEIVLEPANTQREIGGKVRVHVYADSASNLLSMGIKVSFDHTVLQVTEASKYEDVPDGWLMDGDGDPATTGDQYDNPPEEIDNTAGTVTMIGGHLVGDTNSGLSGKVLLGWIVFEAIANGNSNINVDLAKYHPNHPTETFDNFVNVGGGVDEPINLGDLGIICVKDGAHPGDANNNGSIDMGDFTIIRNHMGKAFPDAQYDVLADINGNGSIDMGDFTIVRNHMGKTCLPCP